jgi:hypothetical protein
MPRDIGEAMGESDRRLAALSGTSPDPLGGVFIKTEAGALADLFTGLSLPPDQALGYTRMVTDQVQVLVLQGQPADQVVYGCILRALLTGMLVEESHPQPTEDPDGDNREGV